MSVEQARAKLREAVEGLESALTVLTSAAPDDRAAAQEAFDEAKTIHLSAKEQLQNIEAVSEARAALPVEPNAPGSEPEGFDDEGVELQRGSTSIESQRDARV